MGSSLRKPVAVNTLESLEEEANRLEESAGRILIHARHKGVTKLDDQMRAIKSQSLIIKLCLTKFQKAHTFIEAWWERMEQIFDAFQSLRELTLLTVLEESLLHSP